MNYVNNSIIINENQIEEHIEKCYVLVYRTYMFD